MVDRVEQAVATILHQRPYRETSLLIEAFSRDYGRIALVANGARRPKSRLRALLQPLQELSLSWTQRSELATLRQAESLSANLTLTGDGLFAGFYANELLMRLCIRGDPHADLYDSYRQCLQQMAQAIAPGWALRLFERDLLDAIGYGLLLNFEVDSGAAVQAGMRYHFDPQQGPRRINQSGQNGGAAGISGACLLALHAGDLSDPQLRREAKTILQAALQLHLGDRPLNSVQTLKQLQAGNRQMAIEGKGS
ncbi:MAG: DNA repair protein RecO [Nevskiales bacterium]